MSRPLFVRQRGAFDTPPTTDELTFEVETLSILFEDCDQAVVSYDVVGVASGDFPAQPLEQVIAADQFACQRFAR